MKPLNALLLILLVAITLPTFGQRSGYIVKDSLYRQGFLNFGAENLGVDSVGFTKNKEFTFTYYKATELEEYGLNGKDFVSVNIKGKQVFVRLLAAGHSYLFLSKMAREKEYFIERDLQLTELEKNKFKDQLRESLKYNPEIDELANLTHYRKNSLTRIVKYANDSSNTYFPYSRFGVVAGFAQRNLRIEYRGFTPEFSSPGFMIGTFIELPIEVFTKWSTRFELTYVSSKYSLTTENLYVKRDYDLTLSTINMPLLVRYRSYSAPLMPFFDFGFVVGFNVQRKVNLVETISDPAGPGINELELDIIDKTDLGLALGAGMDYKINYKNSLGLELRYQFNFGMEGEIDHTVGGLQVLASFNF